MVEAEDRKIKTSDGKPALKWCSKFLDRYKDFFKRTKTGIQRMPKRRLNAQGFGTKREHFDYINSMMETGKLVGVGNLDEVHHAITSLFHTLYAWKVPIQMNEQRMRERINNTTGTKKHARV